jgi:hypothetical protein
VKADQEPAGDVNSHAHVQFDASDVRITRIDGRPLEYVDVDAFGHTFRHLLPENAADLITLEREGAIFSHFWDEAAQEFLYYRIPLLPAEIYSYVEAELAQQEFNDALRMDPSLGLEGALAKVSDQEIAKRVIAYGISQDRDGNELDIRGCPASFLPEGMESLLCGGRHDRYERLPKLSDQRDLVGLTEKILRAFPTIAASLAHRQRGKSAFTIEDEYDVQDLLFATLRGAFDSARREEWAPSIAGTSKRIDIVIPDAGIVVEVKFVRSRAHAKVVADELKVDFESYHSHPACQHLFALVCDPAGHFGDPALLAHDLDGLRVKGPHMFTVHVITV